MCLCFLQDEKNQIITTNCWLNQVRSFVSWKWLFWVYIKCECIFSIIDINIQTARTQHKWDAVMKNNDIFQDLYEQRYKHDNNSLPYDMVWPVYSLSVLAWPILSYKYLYFTKLIWSISISWNKDIYNYESIGHTRTDSESIGQSLGGQEVKGQIGQENWMKTE